SPVPRAPEANHELRSVILWVNDYRFAEWTEEELDLDKNGAFNKRLTIPRDKLRRATNLLTLQCYNRGDVRGEAKPVKVYCERPRGPVNLYGVFVGVSNYQDAKPKLDTLRAAEDARAMYGVWQRRALANGPLYKQVELTPPLVDKDATRANILKHLQA